MAKQRKAPAASPGKGPKGDAAPRRTGQGAGSALREMLRRQRENPHPATPPTGLDEDRPKPRREPR